MRNRIAGTQNRDAGHEQWTPDWGQQSRGTGRKTPAPTAHCASRSLARATRRPGARSISHRHAVARSRAGRHPACCGRGAVGHNVQVCLQRTAALSSSSGLAERGGSFLIVSLHQVAGPRSSTELVERVPVSVFRVPCCVGEPTSGRCFPRRIQCQINPVFDQCDRVESCQASPIWASLPRGRTASMHTVSNCVTGIMVHLRA